MTAGWATPAVDQRRPHHAVGRIPRVRRRRRDQRPGHTGRTTVTINMTVDDVDVWFDRAVGEGAEPSRPPARPPQDEFYGRHGKLRDPYGHVWSIGGRPSANP